MKIYKFIKNYRYEAKPNYIKLPKFAKIHLENKSEKYGECWCIVLPKDFYNINYQSIFPKDGFDYHTLNQLELGDYVFIYIFGMLSDNWESMSDEEFYRWVDAYTNQFYIIENTINIKEYTKEINVKEFDDTQLNNSINIDFMEYMDDTRKSVNVHLRETVLTPSSVSKLIKIREGIVDVFSITWKLNEQGDIIDDIWRVEKKKVPIGELLSGSDFRHECSIITDPRLFEEKKKYIINNII